MSPESFEHLLATVCPHLQKSQARTNRVEVNRARVDCQEVFLVTS